MKKSEAAPKPAVASAPAAKAPARAMPRGGSGLTINDQPPLQTAIKRVRSDADPADWYSSQTSLENLPTTCLATSDFS